jgi:2-polyprenyl-3-methyl-5-hydroxy-6-metoxy-1,4-benzoquinol methylase
MNSRAEHEIEHGKKLTAGNPEEIWGWSTPAGMRRAARRGDMILRGAALGPGTTALEIGCGSGVFTEILARSGANILAVDISEDLLQIAFSRNLPPEQVQFVAKRFEDCVLNGPFDAVVGSSVLHHLEIKPALEKIFELLKPGGRMCFTEPNMLNPQIMIQKNIPWIKERLNDSPDETAFFRWSLQSMLEKIGFTAVHITPFDWLHPRTSQSMIDSVAKTGLWLEKIPLVREFAGSLFIRAQRPE